jgi:hypothetical protein
MKLQAQLGIVLLTGLLGFNLAATSAQASCAHPLQDGDFEIQQDLRFSAFWVAEGHAGADIAKNNSLTGRNNAWIRNRSGWNGMRQRLRLTPNRNYVIRAYVRTSSNFKEGYFGIRHANQAVLSEVKFGPKSQYQQLTVNFRTGNATEYNIFTGFWGPGEDAWVQVDNVSLGGSISCADTE